MSIFRSFLLVLVTLLLGGTALLHAQQTPRVDLAVTYVEGHSVNVDSGDHFWLEGGAIQIGSNAWKGWGLAGDITGLHSNTTAKSLIPVSLVIATFGPRYRWHADRKVSMYGEFLVGEADGFKGLYPGVSKTVSSSNALALQTGGGLDYNLREHFAIRMLEAAWVRTQLPNGAGHVQNTLRLGAGIAIRFGR